MKIKKLIGMIFFYWICACITITQVSSCHPCYKRLTSLRNGWGKDTVLVKFPDLPKPILDTLIKYYEASFTKDTTDNIRDLISFESDKQFKDVAYYDAYSPRLRVPFGRYFKIGKKKYFIHYSYLKSPLIYDQGFLYFPAGQYFEKSIQNKLSSQGERWPYDRQLFIKHKIR